MYSGCSVSIAAAPTREGGGIHRREWKRGKDLGKGMEGRGGGRDEGGREGGGKGGREG